MSLAKQFEHNCAEQLNEVKNVFVQRLYDFGNLMGISNICDYIVYKSPKLYLLEMKTTAGNILPFKNISYYQYSSLYKFSFYKGIIAGIVVWFYDRDVTLFIPIDVIDEMTKNGCKSIRYDCNDSRIIRINGKKQRKYFQYEWKEFFKNASKQRKTTKCRVRFRNDRINRNRNIKEIHKRPRRLRG